MAPTQRRDIHARPRYIILHLIKLPLTLEDAIKGPTSSLASLTFLKYSMSRFSETLNGLTLAALRHVIYYRFHLIHLIFMSAGFQGCWWVILRLV
jgi:hypothetical protein